MRMPVRIRPLIPAMLGGIILTLAGFYLIGRVGAFTNPLSKNYAPVESIPQPVRVSSLYGVPAPVPLAAVKNRMLLKSNLSPRVAPLSGIADRNADRQIPPTRPFSRSSQLIRTATVSLEVQDIGRAIHAASSIVNGELGDIINLDYHAATPNDATRASNDAAQTATMSVRVPQYRFESTLDELSALGKATTRTESAQDVADQIVDAQARLRNLRHTESDILKIMDRYGDIEQVLRVTQELSNVREQIEMLDAQLKGMQYQVAYSTITISFSTPAAVAAAPGGSAVLGNAWHAALAALEGLTLSILSFGLWIVAFSPYVLLTVLVGILTMRRLRVHSSAS